MFDNYQNRQREPMLSARAVIIVFCMLGLVFGLWRCYVQSEERRQISEMNDLFSYAPSLPSSPSASSFTRVELPGMSLEMPGSPTPAGDYVTGSVQQMYPVELAVTWQRGEMPEITQLRTIVRAMQQALESQKMLSSNISDESVVSVGGHRGHQFVLSGTGFAMTLTFTTCGGRVVQILVAERGSTTTERMLSTFTCTPDPSKDLARKSIQLDVPDGWRSISDSDDSLVNDNDVFVRPSSVAYDGTTRLEAFIPTSARTAGFEVPAKPAKRGDKLLWRGTWRVDGEDRTAAIVAWQCPGSQVAIVYVATLSKTPIDDGIALALTGRCRDDEDTPR